MVLDIGASAIRLAELAQTKAGHQLVKYYQREYNSDPALDEEERKAIKQKALAELLKEAKVRTRKTIFGVPGQSVFTRSRVLPPVPEYKVSQIVRYEIQQQIPFSLDQIAMDYHILGRTEAGGYDVMMAAIKVDVVDKLIDILQASKRTIDIADVNPLAAYNWLKHTGEFGDAGDCVALIDMGAATTDIVIERDGQFRFTRPLNLGGNDVTLAIASAFSMNFSDAERLKRQRGFAPTGDPNTDGQGGEVIGNVLQRMVSEVMRSFAYFRSLPGGGQVNRVILCGGGACLRNIIPFMQRQLGLEVRIAQPLAGLAVAPGGQQVSDKPEQACVALGMALRCQQTVALEINLIPPRVLEAARRREAAFYWGLSLATLALTMACIIPQSAKENEKVLQSITDVKEKIRRYDPELVLSGFTGSTVPPSKKLQEFKDVETQILGKKGSVDKLDEERNYRHFWMEEMALVNDARPEKMWFSAFETTTITDAAQSRGLQGAGGGVGRPRPFGGGGLAAPPGPGLGGGGLGGGLGRGLGGVGAAANDPNAPTVAVEEIYSSGFPGVNAQGYGGGIGGGGIGGGGIGGGGGLGRSRRDRFDDDEDEDSGMRGAPGMGGAGSRTQEFPPPNGIHVIGFAESSEIIQKFVETLRESERTEANNTSLKVKKVHFSEASVLKVPQSVLMLAWTESNRGYAPQRTGIAPLNEPSVFSFEVNVEFDSPYYEAQPANAAPATVARPGLGGGLGRGLLGGGAAPGAPAVRRSRAERFAEDE